MPRKRVPHWVGARPDWLPFLPPLTGGAQAGNPGSPRDWTLVTGGTNHRAPRDRTTMERLDHVN